MNEDERMVSYFLGSKLFSIKFTPDRIFFIM